VQAVQRNLQRFPGDFMLQLTADEGAHLRSQIGISSAAHGGRRYAPYAFTEHGVAMLATVLNSPRAIQVSIEIVRALCDCARRGPGTQSSRAGSRPLKRNTMRNSGSYLTRSAT